MTTSTRKTRERSWKKRGIKGATVTLYNKLLKEQGGVCAICLRPPKTRRLAFDHNHRTGEPRGLLCWSCNYDLGVVEKNFARTPDRLTRMLAYLKR